MLIFWTSASADVVSKTIGSALKKMRPNVPEHRFVAVDESSDVIPSAEPGDVVVVCGAKALNALQKVGIFPKNRTVTALRGKTARPTGQGWYMVTFDPYLSTSDPTKRDEIDWDVRLATRLMHTGSLDPEVGNYTYVSSFKSLIQRIEAKWAETKKPVDVSCDTETMSFFPWYPDRDIISISFTLEYGSADVLYLGPQDAPVVLDHSEPIFDQISWLLNSPKVRLRFANGKYDLIWIGEKWGIECTNFKFDSMLVGSLVDENRNNSLNNHAKIYTPIGGYDDCPAVGTRICTADLRWVPIEAVKPGDKLVGFDEQTAPGLRRKMRVAEAVSSKRLMKSGVEVVFDNGTVLRCSADHGFVAHRRTKGNGPFEWVRAHALKPGCRVMLVIPVEQEDGSREAGYLAGLYDGEGYVSKAGAGMISGISQRPGVVWDRYLQGMTALGFGGFYAHQKNGDGVLTSKHSGWETLRLLQVLRPQRLLDKQGFDGHCVPSGAPQVRVVSVTPIGDIEVVSLQTTTRTFVTEGIASHNSFNGKYDKGHMEQIPAGEDFLTYAGGDTDACQRASDVIKEELLEDTQLANFYVTILHPAARAFEKMERRGVMVDQHKFQTLRDDLRKEINAQEKIALELLPAKLRIKHMEKIEDQLAQGKSPLTSAILKDYFFGPNGLHLKPMMLTGKTKEPSTARAHLKMFFDHPDAKAMGMALETHGSASKTLSTFVDGFLAHLRPDGMLHPTYFLGHAEFEDADDEESGTVTGRLSAKNPAFQTLPKKTKWAKRLRECYIAPPGKAILSLDFSQGELRVVACVAPEKNMIHAYENGLDLHAVTGAKLAGIPIDEFMTWKDNPDAALADMFDKFRGNAKPANFGLLYGMGPEGFQAYAWLNYGLKMTIDEATKTRNAFFELYPGLTTYHDRARSLVRMHKMVRSPLGRVRHLPTIDAWDREVKSRAERQAINSPIQSTLTDMMIWSIALIEDAYGDDIATVGMIHDAMIAYVDADKVEMRAAQAAEVMSNLPFKDMGWSPQLRFPADAEWSASDLAHMQKLKLAA